ncbi:B3 domain-containing protein At1g05920-like [Corylus avellana]|uniref:B3 domain-containing protein At1g05920-like n=1 Tax=Corylus avellana TaxID=13451 RepID=UPI00286C4396|nr:B3 domain-containing protein At1g05920-like [Corylus avellana]XP_059448268.1 B3 domain-containing protein At1g05920-like [Corylus avellana]
MATTLEDLRGDSPAIFGDFNKIKEEVIRAAGGNPNEVERLLTKRILMDFLQFHMKKRKQYLEKPLEKKKKRKPLELAANNSGRKFRKPKRQRKNPTEIKLAVPDRPPYMPTEFMDKIMGQASNIKLVIQKVLTDTDMKRSQDRLSIPTGQMRYDFLSSEEKVSLEKKEANGIHFKGMEVPLIEPGLQVSSIFLKKWKLGSGSCIMLSKPWMDVAKRNELKPGNNVQLWSFRVNQKLHLALIKLPN